MSGGALRFIFSASIKGVVSKKYYPNYLVTFYFDAVRFGAVASASLEDVMNKRKYFVRYLVAFYSLNFFFWFFALTQAGRLKSPPRVGSWSYS